MGQVGLCHRCGIETDILQFINLPDGRLLFLNGGHLGTAGYGPEE